MPNKRPKVHKGSDLPSTRKMSAIKSDLKRNPSKAISVKSRGIEKPSIEITSSGGGRFTRPASKKRSMGATQTPIDKVPTTSKEKPINYNLVKKEYKSSMRKMGEDSIDASRLKGKKNYGG